MPDKPFFVYFAPGATHAPHHVPTEWSDKYKGQFDQGWDELREETFARQKELGVIPPDAELTARPEEIPAWDEMPDDLKPVLARADGGLRRLPRAHRPPRRPADRRARGARRSSRTRSSTTSSATTARRPRARSTARFNEMFDVQRRGRARDARVHGRRTSTSSARPRPTTTTPSAGRTRWTRRTSGPSRSPRTGAARATARSSTGRTASRPRARSARQFHHVIDVAPTVLEAAGLPEPTIGQRRRSRRRSRASACATPSTTRTRPSGTRRSTSRCSATAASTTRAGRRSPATARRG